MDRFYKMMKRDNKGFTLVELMVVLLIIGILVAIAIPIYNNVTGKANLNAIAANLRTIDGAIMQYIAIENDDPSKDNLSGEYIQTWPEDDPKGTEYLVENVNEGTIGADPLFKAQVVVSEGVTGVAAATYDLAGIKALMNPEDEDED